MLDTTNLDGLQTRSFTVRAAADSDGRTLTGIAVPYGVETLLWDGLYEQFAPGSIEDTNAILRYGHREPLGRILSATDTPEGRSIDAHISATARGDEVVTLIGDGVLTSMSIGFDGIERTITDREDGTQLITWNKVIAREYSVVEFPAYPTAKITEIRHQQGAPTMDPITRADLDAVERSTSEALADMNRTMTALQRSLTEPDTNASIPLEFRSFAEYAKALAGKGERSGAQEMATRAFTGAVVGDSIARPGWLGNLEKRMTLKQPVCNMFTHTTNLPAEGMTVEYGIRKADTTVKVGKQAAEGDNLVAGKPGTYEIKSAPVQTFGGYGEMSLQAIDRATESLLDDLLYDQAYIYATEIENAARTLFTTTATTAEATPLRTIAGAITVDNMIEAAVALMDAYDDTPYPLDGIAVSSDVFLELAKLGESKKALQFAGAPTDKQGTITVANAEGSFLAIPVKRVAKWTGRHMAGYSADALHVKEQPGAPLRLQDQNIVNLTKGFSVYGYAAIFAPKPALIKAMKFTA